MYLAGQKVLWTINFQHPHSLADRPEITFTSKNSPYGRMQAYVDAPLRNKAQDFLNKIQAMCTKITEDCQKEALTDTDYLKKSHLVSKELGDLDELIKKLNDILKWFRPPESREKPDL